MNEIALKQDKKELQIADFVKYEKYRELIINTTILLINHYLFDYMCMHMCVYVCAYVCNYSQEIITQSV